MTNRLQKLLVGVLLLGGVGNVQAAALTSDAQIFSYALGLRLAQDIHQQGIDIDVDALTMAIKDAFSGTPPRVSLEDMQRAIMVYQQAQLAEHSALAKKNLETGNRFLNANKDKKGVVVRESGLQYEVIKAGKGARPSSNDVVTVNYRGTLLDGTEFDSSERHGQPLSFPVGNVIEGWKEALPLMKVGAKWRIFVPADLAYGERGTGGGIGPNETLIFEIELLSIGEGKG